MEDTRKTRPSESSMQDAYELPKTEAASTGSEYICTKFFAYIY